MELHSDVERCVDAILAKVGKRLRVATPLAIGKPNHLLNAIYRRAKADPSIDLHIFTALTLQRPVGKSDLEKRFLGPLVERLWGDYPDLDYELDRVAGSLPDNIRVFEFYFYAGKFIGNSSAQRDYISTNYTHVARDLLARDINVLAQQVSRGSVDGKPALSLSSNADVSPDLVSGLQKAGRPFVMVGQVNAQLPFMYGDALQTEQDFDFLLDDPRLYHRPFATPKTAISDAEYMIGLYASTLVRDGGSLQIGIGSIGDALVYALLLRHQQNAVYLDALARLRILERFGDVIAQVGGTEPFVQGLFAPTEMLVDGFMHLIEAGIVKRVVYDDIALQRMAGCNKPAERPSLQMLDALLAAGAIPAVLDQNALAYLQHWGIFKPTLTLGSASTPDRGLLVLQDGTRVSADLRSPETRARIEAHAFGDRLLHGRAVHAGFFLGPHVFYEWLRGLPEERRKLIDMRPVTRINQLYGNQELAELQRRDARFINTGMMATLLGAVVSDGLDSGQVVSGVGGQYNFVAMAHALAGARSILQVRSTRTAHGELASNIVYAYGHTTIARHLRDILVTDHGIADLRGRTDEEVIHATLCVTDSQFQLDLIARAQHDGKLSAAFELPSEHAQNHVPLYTDELADFRQRGLFPAFPFGTELTPEEVELGGALRALKERMESVPGEIAALTSAATSGAPDDDVMPLLQRMGLTHPHGVQETLYARLLASELRRQRKGVDA
jgi:acyl-CoA hydrolase